MMQFTQIVHRIQFIGGLFSCALEDFYEAAQELFINVLISTIPIWAGILFMRLQSQESRGYRDLLVANIMNGELIIYCTTFLAPIFFLIFRQRKTNGFFPSGISINIIAILILLIVTIIFIVIKRW